MGFNRLPPEIIFHICELFCDHCHGSWYENGPPSELFQLEDPYTSLRALSLVCKSIGYIAQRVLHHHFGYTRAGKEAMAKLCRTISSNPELARELRWADLTWWSTGSIVPKDIVGGWLPETINKLSPYLLNGGEGISDDDFLTAIILLQAPNLERLEDNRERLVSAFDRLNHDAVIRDHALPPNLKQLSLGRFVNAYYRFESVAVDLSWEGLGGFINTFKKLESLIIHCPLAEGVDERLSFQSLRALQLHGFKLPLEDFENLISRIPNLETFRFSRQNFSNVYMLEHPTGPEILGVLAKRNDTLRRLELHISCTHEDVTALKELTNLEELKMGLGASHRRDYSRGMPIGKQYFKSIMPPSLRKLHLMVYKTVTFEEASDALITYISSTYRQSPNDQRLQMVHINLSWHRRDWAAWQEDTIQRGCQLWAKNGTLVFGK
ncbi:hypothetical protein CEP51_006591 [Fusarium floridanum]|uniref:F-box domain-containing protein n=1 Tax=Fusarium floridanum TaxID=1325733 RepID=A0A428RS72_9HYPO|nr:hypothetical protein CEP51_006591 [Fusarium floridanum]